MWSVYLLCAAYCAHLRIQLVQAVHGPAGVPLAGRRPAAEPLHAPPRRPAAEPPPRVVAAAAGSGRDGAV